MSSTFDIMQQALSTLKERVGDDRQARDMLVYLKVIVDDLHDYHHEHCPRLNFIAGNVPNLLLTVLKYQDDEERARWLSLKQ